MRTRSRHPRIWLAALTASVGALVLGLVPGTTAASAGPTGPVVNFVDYSSVGTHSVGSSLLDGTAKTALTPGGYLAYGYDVSDDGNTMLLSLARGSLSSAARDRTYALLLVSRVGAEVTSTILTNYWDTNPVLSADGSTAWWLAGDRVWKHQAGVSTMVSTDFVRHSDETTVGFSVSADGTAGAVVYREDGTVRTSTYTRLFAEDFVAGKAAPYLDWTGSLAAFYTNPTWLTSASLLFSYTDTSVTHNATATLGPSGGDVDTAQVYGDPGIYDVQQLGSAWWAAQGDTTSGFATAAAPTDFASATFTPFPLSASTASYLMSDVTPPAVTVPTNRARSYPAPRPVGVGREVPREGRLRHLGGLPHPAARGDALERRGVGGARSPSVVDERDDLEEPEGDVVGASRALAPVDGQGSRLHARSHPQHVVPVDLSG